MGVEDEFEAWMNDAWMNRAPQTPPLNRAPQTPLQTPPYRTVAPSTIPPITVQQCTNDKNPYTDDNLKQTGKPKPTIKHTAKPSTVAPKPSMCKPSSHVVQPPVKA